MLKYAHNWDYTQIKAYHVSCSKDTCPGKLFTKTQRLSLSKQMVKKSSVLRYWEEHTFYFNLRVRLPHVNLYWPIFEEKKNRHKPLLSSSVASFCWAHVQLQSFLKLKHIKYKIFSLKGGQYAAFKWTFELKKQKALLWQDFLDKSHQFSTQDDYK